MSTQRFIWRSVMPARADVVFDWHTRPGALQRLTPPWETVRLVESQGGVQNGGRVVLEVKAGGFWRRWVAEHYDYQQGHQFCDLQAEGPFSLWRHCHRTLPGEEATSVLEDDIEYALPLGGIGDLLGGAMVRRKLERMFRYRHRVTAGDLSLHQRYAGGKAMRVAITGATGLVGSALAPLLTTGGHEVLRVVRSNATQSTDVTWDPARGNIDGARMEGVDAVVHLAGENIAAQRWSTAQKARIRDSRVNGTRLLCEALARLRQPPRVLVASSAIGFYGNRGDAELNESSSKGTGFLADVCDEWESATEPARKAGIRVVNLRFGVILSPAGGALAKMLTPFRFGVGGRIGDGRQWMSWIALDDAVGAVYHVLRTDALNGPVNAVAPNPVTNYDFTKTLGKVLRRPTILPMPGFLARLAIGEMADDLLLASTRVLPKALCDSQYSFLYPDLEKALRHLLGKDLPAPSDKAVSATGA